MGNAKQLESTQMVRVLNALKRATWLTLVELNNLTGDPVPSVSAQIRHLRKPEHGSHLIVKRRRGRSESGLFEYHLVIPHGEQPERAA